MAHSNPSAETTYQDLYATVVDALRHDLRGEALERSAHEVLERLRDSGLSIPSKSAT
jgi:hypothetical protein